MEKQLETEFKTEKKEWQNPELTQLSINKTLAISTSNKVDVDGFNATS